MKITKIVWNVRSNSHKFFCYEGLHYCPIHCLTPKISTTGDGRTGPSNPSPTRVTGTCHTLLQRILLSSLFLLKTRSTLSSHTPALSLISSVSISMIPFWILRLRSQNDLLQSLGASSICFNHGCFHGGLGIWSSCPLRWSSPSISGC